MKLAFELDQELKDAHSTADIVVAELRDLGKDVALDVNVLHLSDFLEPLHHSVLLESVEVYHNGFAAELLEAFDVGIVADEDHRSIDLRPALFLLLGIWLSKRLEASSRRSGWCLFFIALLLCLIVLRLPSLEGLFRIRLFLLRRITTNDPSFYIIQHFLDPVLVAVQRAIYLVNYHADGFLLSSDGLVTDQVVDLSDEGLA